MIHKKAKEAAMQLQDFTWMPRTNKNWNKRKILKKMLQDGREEMSPPKCWEPNQSQQWRMLSHPECATLRPCKPRTENGKPHQSRQWGIRWAHLNSHQKTKGKLAKLHGQIRRWLPPQSLPTGVIKWENNRPPLCERQSATKRRSESTNVLTLTTRSQGGKS